MTASEILRRLGAEATAAPWAWGPSSSKDNGYVIGTAFREDGTAVPGRLPDGCDDYDEETGTFVDEAILYDLPIGVKEAATVNYRNAAYITKIRNAHAAIVAVVGAAEGITVYRRIDDEGLVCVATDDFHRLREALATLAAALEGAPDGE